MRAGAMVFLLVVTLIGFGNAHEGMIALYTDSTLVDNDAELPVGGNYYLEVYYIQDDGPELGLACEFRLVLSTPDAEFLLPIWCDDIVVKMGDITNGISLSASNCMGGWHGIEYFDAVHIGTVPVRNHADLDTFTVSLVGHPGVTPPAVQITECSAGNPFHVVEGGTFTFNGTAAEPVAPWLHDAAAEFPNEVRVVFSEEISIQTAEVPTHYCVFETFDSFEPVPVVGAELAQDLKTVIIALGGYLSGKVDYSACASNVEDLEGNQMAPDTIVGIRITDTTPPAVAAVSLTSTNIMEIEFSEWMDRATTEDASYYCVSKYGDPSFEGWVVHAQLSNDLMSVVLLLHSRLEAQACYYLHIDNVEDWAGNAIPSRVSQTVTIPLAISHTPVDVCAAGQDLHILWEVSDHLYGLENTCLYYRRSGEAEWVELCESNPINPVVMMIAGAEVTGEGLEYYITAVNGIGATVYHGAPGDPHVIPACPPVSCEQPILSLVGYHSLEYVPPLWRVDVEMLNAGPGTAHNVAVTMNESISWLMIPDPSCHYGDIPAGETGLGAADCYCFDLSYYMGGSFNVWFSVTYEDSCGSEYRLSLDPEFDPEGGEQQAPVHTYGLAQNYPNPFNPSTSISFQIPVAGPVEIMIFDVGGRFVRTLIEEHRERGRYTIGWNGTDSKGSKLPSGIYFYRLQSGTFSETKKMLLLR